MPTINIAPKAMQNGDNVTVYKDTIGPQQQTYTFLTSQERVILKNSGSKNITYTVGSQSGLLGPSQSVEVKETISSINLTAEQGTQQFEIWADESNSPILFDGNTFGKKKLALNFNSNITFKVSDLIGDGVYAFQFQNFDYIEIKGLKLVGNLIVNGDVFTKNGVALNVTNGPTVGNYSIWINDCKQAVVEKCDFSYSSRGALFCKRVDDVTAINNKFYYDFMGGITASVSLTRVFIQNNRVEGIGDRGQSVNYVSGGIGILVSESDNVTIDNNKLYGWNDTSTKTEGCNNVRYLNNDVINFGKDGIKVMGYPNSSYGDRTKIVNAEIKNNYIKNRYDGRPDGSSYLLMHDVTNGVIDGNIVTKDNAITGTHDGIRVNTPIGHLGGNIKIVNNQINLNGDFNSLTIDGGSYELTNISVKNNTFSVKASIVGVTELEFENNKLINCNLASANLNLLYMSKVFNVKVNKNVFDTVNVALANIQGIYINIDKGMDFIEVNDNILKGVSSRAVVIQSNTFPTSDKITQLSISNNVIVDFITQTISFPSSCFYITGDNLKFDVVKCKNNNTKKSSAAALDMLYWFHTNTNQKASITEYENNLLNLAHASMKNTHSQMGRLIGKPIMDAAPSYITDFQTGDVVFKRTTSNDKIMWKLIAGAWAESY
jgi:hypothetical protein